MITTILLLAFLQITVAAPSQMLHPFQGIMKHQMFQPPQETTHRFPLLQQLQRIQQLVLQGEIQMQQQAIVQEQVPLLQPLQGTVLQQQLAMQEQMFALQQFQAMQRMNLGSPVMNTQPILVLFPNNESDMQQMDYNTNSLKYQKPEGMGDDDSEIIEAEKTEELNSKQNLMRAVLLIPNTRGILGDFIGTIPFLPLEVNVPDTISWIYNGIAGIIAGIGQSLPFRPQTLNSKSQNEEDNTMKSIWNKMKKNQQLPVVMVPLGLL